MTDFMDDFKKKCHLLDADTHDTFLHNISLVDDELKLAWMHLDNVMHDDSLTAPPPGDSKLYVDDVSDMVADMHRSFVDACIGFVCDMLDKMRLPFLGICKNYTRDEDVSNLLSPEHRLLPERELQFITDELYGLLIFNPGKRHLPLVLKFQSVFAVNIKKFEKFVSEYSDAMSQDSFDRFAHLKESFESSMKRLEISSRMINRI